MVLASMAGAIPCLAADRWVGIQSEHLLLVGNASEGRLKSIARDLEHFRAALTMVMPGISKRTTAGTTVFVFKDDAAFTPYKPHYRGQPASVSGYFQPGLDVSIIALNGEIQTPSVIYHEYAHRLTQGVTARLPPWANEGLAEFYSTFRTGADGGSFELGRPIDHHLLLLRRQASLIPLATLLAVQRDSPSYNESSKQGPFYAQSWALIHYLIAGNHGARRAQLSRYLELVSGGAAIDVSFRAAFQTDYAAIEQELREYLRQATMTYFKTTLATRMEVDRTFRAIQVSDARAAAYRGELLVRLGREDAAERELRKAIALEPGTAAALKSLGLLRARQKSFREALELLTQSVDADEADYLTHFHLAQLLEQLAGDEQGEQRRIRLERMRSHALRSIELAPRFVEAYAALAYAALALGDGLEFAEQSLIAATREAPGREDLQLMLAEVMMANGRHRDARSVVATVRASAVDPDLRRHAETLQAELQSREPETGRPPANSGADLRVEGVLVNIRCENGITLDVRTERGLVQLHSDTLDGIRFVTLVATSPRAISCGPMQPDVRVSVLYRLADSPEWLGEPTVVEFRPTR